MKKLHLFKQVNLAEIFQAVEVKLAFLNKVGREYTQAHATVQCRDFLGDCIWAESVGKRAFIYSFEFDPTKQHLDKDKVRLSLKFPDENTYNLFHTNFKSVQYKDSLAGVAISKLYKTNQPLTIIVEASKYWQSAQWKISLYTYYLKLACYPNFVATSKPEVDYQNELKIDYELKFLSKVKSKFHFLHEDIYSAHNKSGFVSICKNYNTYLNEKLLGGN